MFEYLVNYRFQAVYSQFQKHNGLGNWSVIADQSPGLSGTFGFFAFLHFDNDKNTFKVGQLSWKFAVLQQIPHIFRPGLSAEIIFLCQSFVGGPSKSSRPWDFKNLSFSSNQTAKSSVKGIFFKKNSHFQNFQFFTNTKTKKLDQTANFGNEHNFATVQKWIFSKSTCFNFSFWPPAEPKDKKN